MQIQFTPRDTPMELKIVPMDVEYLDHMGTDLDVVNAARVSFAKEHHDFIVGKDDRLIRYLALNKHWTPFAHTAVKFRIKAPIYVARQLHKHQVGLVVNEESRRYISSTPEFYLPDRFRKSAENVKQGSDPIAEVETITVETDNAGVYQTENIHSFSTDVLQDHLMIYQAMLDNNVAPELARSFLPLATMTSWIWTGSVAAFARVCNLRIDPHAQHESKEIAERISQECLALFPVSWKALTCG